MSHDWVKVGGEVVFVPRSSGRPHGRVAKIEKVYKNGRFIVEGDNGQWTPYQYTDGRRGATSSGSYSGMDVHPFDGPERAAAEKSWRWAKAKEVVIAEMHRLEKMVAYGSYRMDEIIAEAAAINGRANNG